MTRKTAPFTWIDWLLLLAIAVLSVQLLVMLLGPAVEAWRNRPRPGVQVPQQCLVEQGGGKDAAKIPVGYLLYLPSEYNRTAKWPLVVYLHGAGSRGQDLKLVRREWLPAQIVRGKQFDFILLSPQCPAHSSWSPELVVGLIEKISKSFSVDQDRVYLTGQSMGGFGTWATASHDPGRFAAIAPVCGGGDPQQAERLKNMPIWAFHGAKDNVVPLEASEQMVDAVKKCGGQVQFSVLPNAGHGISEATYGDGQLYKWLLSHRRTPATASTEID